jgi:hypothetical protein
MGYTDEAKYKMGKILVKLINKEGVPKLKGGEITFKMDAGDEGVVKTFYTSDEGKSPIDVRRINVIFTPNGKYAYHNGIIQDMVLKKINESCDTLGIYFSYSEIKRLINLFISINGNVIPWNYQNSRLFYIPKETKKEIIYCIPSNNLTYTTANQNILNMRIDYTETEIEEIDDSSTAGMYVNFGFKDITINNEKISFREMNESGLISALMEEIKFDDDLQMDSENCAYRALANDIDFEASDEIFLNAYPYLTSINGVSTNNINDDSENSVMTIIDEIAKKNGW